MGLFDIFFKDCSVDSIASALFPSFTRNHLSGRPCFRQEAFEEHSKILCFAEEKFLFQPFYKGKCWVVTKLYEITERENQHLTKIVETQKHMIDGLVLEKDVLKTAFNELNKQLDKTMALCDQQQELLDEIMEKMKE